MKSSKRTLISAFAAILLITACGDDSSDNHGNSTDVSVCTEITCGGHGKCAVTLDNSAVCICDNGYHTEPSNADNCVLDSEEPNACKDITCGDHGKCAVTQEDTAVCICDDGYHTDSENAANCVIDAETPNACKDITCGGHGKCAVTQTGSAVCICDDGYYADPGNANNCIETPNACKDITCGDHGKCAVTQEGTAICICDDGHHADPENAGNCVLDAKTNYEVGDTIVFGHYEQDNDTTNGKEPIVWRILDKNDSGQYLIISEQVLDVKPYNTTDIDITWEKSTIRSWLNGYDASYNTAGNNYASDNFLDTAFTTTEKAKIITSNVQVDKYSPYDTDQGNATTDKIFLLNNKDLVKYLLDNDDAQAIATLYAINNSVYSYNIETKERCTKTNAQKDKCAADWWLRSPGKQTNYAAYITTDGNISYSGTYVTTFSTGVRPALWIQSYIVF